MICSSLCRVPFNAVLLSWVGETHILLGTVFGATSSGRRIQQHIVVRALTAITPELREATCSDLCDEGRS